jgi:hypothetical protein
MLDRALQEPRLAHFGESLETARRLYDVGNHVYCRDLVGYLIAQQSDLGDEGLLRDIHKELEGLTSDDGDPEAETNPEIDRAPKPAEDDEAANAAAEVPGEGVARRRRRKRARGGRSVVHEVGGVTEPNRVSPVRSRTGQFGGSAAAAAAGAAGGPAPEPTDGDGAAGADAGEQTKTATPAVPAIGPRRTPAPQPPPFASATSTPPPPPPPEAAWAGRVATPSDPAMAAVPATTPAPPPPEEMRSATPHTLTPPGRLPVPASVAGPRTMIPYTRGDMEVRRLSTPLPVQVVESSPGRIVFTFITGMLIGALAVVMLVDRFGNADRPQHLPIHGRILIGQFPPPPQPVPVRRVDPPVGMGPAHRSPVGSPTGTGTPPPLPAEVATRSPIRKPARAKPKAPPRYQPPTSEPRGTLVVESRPKTAGKIRVFIDKKYLGTAPLRVQVSPGLHEVKTVGGAGYPEIRMVRVSPGAVASVVASTGPSSP